MSTEWKIEAWSRPGKKKRPPPPYAPPSGWSRVREQGGGQIISPANRVIGHYDDRPGSQR